MVATVKGGGEEVKRQAEAMERLREFNKLFAAEPKIKELPGKQSGAESRTTVTFFFESHTLPHLRAFEEHITKKKPDVIVLEEPKDPRFIPMLEGKISMEEYLQKYVLASLESVLFVKGRYELMRELHEKGVKIEQSDPQPTNIIGVMEKERKSTPFPRSDFEIKLLIEIDSAKVDARKDKAREEMRSKEIAEKIRGGEWSGEILVEAGASHTRMKNILKEELKGIENVRIEALYPLKELTAKTFGGPILKVHQPLDELTRIYKYEKQPSEDREKLMAARQLIFETMAKTTTIDETIKIVNRLSYEECKNLFDEIKGMGKDDAFKQVENYLKNKGK